MPKHRSSDAGQHLPPEQPVHITEEQMNHDGAASNSDLDSYLSIRGQIPSRAHERDPRIDQRLQNMATALNRLRDHFSDEASHFMDVIRTQIEQRKLGQSEDPETFFHVAESQYKRLSTIHDTYGALEVDYNTMDRELRLEAQSRSRRDISDLEMTDELFDQLFPSSESGFEFASESSVMESQLLSVHLLIQYVDKLAVVDHYSELLDDSQTIRTTVLEGLTNTSTPRSQTHPYSADLVAEYDLQSEGRSQLLQTATKEAHALHDELRHAGLISEDSIFDQSVRLDPWRAPPRSTLLLPLDKLMEEEPYDQFTDIISDHANYTPRGIAFRVNTWLLSILRRSRFQVLLFKNALDEAGVAKPNNKETDLLAYWTDDEITKRLYEMPTSTLYTVGSSPTSKRVSAPGRRIPTSKASTHSSDGTRIDDFYYTGQQFIFPEHERISSVHGVSIDSGELMELFEDLDDDDIPIVPVK